MRTRGLVIVRLVLLLCLLMAAIAAVLTVAAPGDVTVDSATDASGNTSEFSAAVEVEQATRFYIFLPSCSGTTDRRPPMFGALERA